MNRKSIMIISLSLLALLVIVVGSRLVPQPQNNPGKLRVVAAENFWGNIAAQIGGERVQVMSVISDPEADPHLYESGAKDASAITSAQVVIVNGLGYDDFIDKILATSPNPSRTVIKAADIGKTDANDNPHIWYDLPRVLVIAGDIEAALSKQDPAGQTTYKQNLQVFLDSIIPTLDQINAIGAQYPGAAVAYTERVPEYLLAQAGLKVVSPASFAAAIEAGNEPSPADQAAMMALITHKQIRALIYNAQAESPATKALREAAEANNIPVVAVTETLPSAYQTYQAWQQAQIDALAKALAATK